MFIRHHVALEQRLMQYFQGGGDMASRNALNRALKGGSQFSLLNKGQINVTVKLSWEIFGWNCVNISIL